MPRIRRGCGSCGNCKDSAQFKREAKAVRTNARESRAAIRDMYDREGYTVVHRAAMNADETVLHKALQEGEDPMRKTATGCSTLMLAASLYLHKNVETLLETGSYGLYELLNTLDLASQGARCVNHLQVLELLTMAACDSVSRGQSEDDIHRLCRTVFWAYESARTSTTLHILYEKLRELNMDYWDKLYECVHLLKVNTIVSIHRVMWKFSDVYGK